VDGAHRRGRLWWVWCRKKTLAAPSLLCTLRLLLFWQNRLARTWLVKAQRAAAEASCLPVFVVALLLLPFVCSLLFQTLFLSSTTILLLPGNLDLPSPAEVGKLTCRTCVRRQGGRKSEKVTFLRGRWWSRTRGRSQARRKAAVCGRGAGVRPAGAGGSHTPSLRLPSTYSFTRLPLHILLCLSCPLCLTACFTLPYLLPWLFCL